ncbi:MAG: flagellar assembly protein FliW [Nitrospirota bacterium]
MKVRTSRFGEIEVREEMLLTFPSGLIGFPRATRYVILDHDREAPFKWLQSVDEGGLAFVIMVPTLFRPDYRAVLAPEDIAELGPVETENLSLFVILTIPPGDPRRITANLQGPVVVNQRSRLAKQVILRDEYPTRYPLFPDEAVRDAAAEPLACGTRRP